MLDFLCLIQARLYSTRLPGKCLMTVGGVPMVRRVWDAAKGCRLIDKVVVAWPERYPDLDENNVLERFTRLSREFPSWNIIRLTADCPLLTSRDINNAVLVFQREFPPYYSNHSDGHDVQVFASWMLQTKQAHKEHVIADFNTPSTGLSVNTREDLERVRKLC